MKPTDHAIVEAAVKAKRAQAQQQQAGAVPKAAPVSTVNKAVTAGIWVAAVGSLAAVFMAN